MTPAEWYATAQQAGKEEEIRRAVEAVYCQNNFSAFVRNGWPVLHESEPIKWGYHIDCISEHLEAVARKEIFWLFINVPPGFAKSLLCSVFFPAWLWLDRPWFKLLCSSTNDVVTLRDARRHKQLVQSLWYQNTFNPNWQISQTQSADSNFGNTRGGERVSRTVNSSIIGIRPHGRILDDGNDPERIGSENYEDTNYWFENTLLKRRAHLDSFLVNVQQRLRENDLTGYALAREGNPKMVHLFLPNRYEPKRFFTSPVIEKKTQNPWRDWRTKEDELLHPPTLDQKTTDSERANDEAMDAAQNQQNPVPPGGVIFKADEFKRWSHEPTIADWPAGREPDFEVGAFPTYPLPPMDYEIITVDLNNQKQERGKKTNDWCVMDCWGQAHETDYYLLQQVRKKMGPSVAINLLVQIIRQRMEMGKLACVLIENKANGPTVIHGVRALLNLSHEEKLPGTHQFIRPWDIQGEKKDQRARAISYVTKAGRVYIPDEHEDGDMRYWLNEVTGFPNKTFDDRVDTMVMALTFFERSAQFG